MATLLMPSEYLHLIQCPACMGSSTLVAVGSEAVCSQCKGRYPVTDGILEFVSLPGLDPEKARELKGNTFEMTEEIIAHNANKDTWSDYGNRCTARKLRLLLGYLSGLSLSRLVSLGSGTGYEIKCLSKLVQLQTVYCSDLSFSALSIAKQTLQGVPVDLALFTSDLDRCPFGAKDVPVVVYEALHHTPDMHATIERLVQHGYNDLLFVEPTSNFLIRSFARIGWAQRIEYSGVKPDRLDLSRVRKLAAREGYTLRVKTLWEFPEDYYKKFGWFKGVIPPLVDLFSFFTSPFSFGNYSVVHLRKAAVAGK